MNITDEQIELMKKTSLDSGENAWDYVLSQNEEDRPYIIAGILSCIKKGYGLTILEINWETRNLRYGKELL
jgi:hypothetical protein